MRCWPARADRVSGVLAWAAAAGLTAGCATEAPDTGLSITNMNTSVSGGRCTVELELDIGLTDAVLEALHNGVPIQILVESRVLEPRRWLWSRTLSDDARRFSLSYHSLSSQYLIRWPDTEEYRAYPSRMAAISVLETPDPWELELPNGEPKTELIAETRVRLDLQSLPAPLRLVAYFSPEWRIGSGWRRAKLALPGHEEGSG